MTTDQVLSVLRRYIDEVDQAVSTLTDEELLKAISDARDKLELRKVQGVASLTVQPDVSLANYGITPDSSLEQGHMLALQAAINLLEAKYRNRLFQGELGTAWRSGLEEESTISAEKAYRAAIATLVDQLTDLILIKRAPLAGTRPQ